MAMMIRVSSTPMADAWPNSSRWKADSKITMTAVRVESPGPPRVRTYGWSNTWRALMMAMTDATRVVGLSSGSVTWRCLRQPVAPSIAAASYVSTGMEARPPMNRRKEKPKFCQTYTRITTEADPPGVVSQGTAGMPTRDRDQLTTPNCSLKRYRMKMDTEAADRISGKKNADRKNTRSHAGIFSCTMTASARASPSWSATATTTNTMVFRKETRTVGSWTTSEKLSKPTKVGAEMMSQRKKARTTEATMGIRVNRPMPRMVGARKIQASQRWLCLAPLRPPAL